MVLDEDGTYVFREVKIMGSTYKGLTTNKIIGPDTGTSATSSI